MKIEKSAYAGVSNLVPLMLYAPKYTTLNVIPSKISAIEVPGIENRRAETYPRPTGKGLEDAGITIARF